MDVLDHAELAFPTSLPEFQRLFPDDAACAAYLEKARWDGGFVCPHCREWRRTIPLRQRGRASCAAANVAARRG